MERYEYWTVGQDLNLHLPPLPYSTFVALVVTDGLNQIGVRSGFDPYLAISQITVLPLHYPHH